MEQHDNDPHLNPFQKFSLVMSAKVVKKKHAIFIR